MQELCQRNIRLMKGNSYQHNRRSDVLAHCLSTHSIDYNVLPRTRYESPNVCLLARGGRCLYPSVFKLDLGQAPARTTIAARALNRHARPPCRSRAPRPPSPCDATTPPEFPFPQEVPRRFHIRACGRHLQDARVCLMIATSMGAREAPRARPAPRMRGAGHTERRGAPANDDQRRPRVTRATTHIGLGTQSIHESNVANSNASRPEWAVYGGRGCGPIEAQQPPLLLLKPNPSLPPL